MALELLTVVIPAAPYHEAIVREAIASVRAQTVRCAVEVILDGERRGASWARNQGLARVETPFVAFLDADDLLESTFAEELLRFYDGRHYVFTDWRTDKVVEAPCRPWAGDGTAHIVTTLLPTAWARRVDGFDETLPGGEDTDFYWKLTRSGFCGRRFAKPLVQYRKGGARAQAFITSPAYQTIMRGVVERYKGKAMTCTDCGGNLLDINLPPMNEPQEGDVLAEALWAGERPERGRISRRIYRGGWNSRLWVDPRDVDAAPHLFARVIEAPPRVTDAQLAALAKPAAAHGEPLRAFARSVFGALQPAPPEPMPVYAPDPTVIVQPDVSRLLELYNPNMALSNQELDAVRHGAVLEINTQGVKVNRPFAPDYMSREQLDLNDPGNFVDGIPR